MKRLIASLVALVPAHALAQPLGSPGAGNDVPTTLDPGGSGAQGARPTPPPAPAPARANPNVVVVDKEAGLLSVPVPSLRGESLQDLLMARDRLRGRRAPEVRAVHRIDRFTSGLVAFARSRRAFGVLRREFASGSPERNVPAA